MSKNIKIDYNLPAATLAANNPTIAYLHQGRESDTGRTKTGTAAVAHWNSLQYDDAGSKATTTEVDAITANAPTDGDTLKELADRITALEGAPGGGSSVLAYKALISQAGVAAPTAIIIENTLGFVPTWLRLDVAISESAGTEPGVYGFVIPGLTANRLFARPYSDFLLTNYYRVAFSETDYGGPAVEIHFESGGGPDANDNVMLNLPFEIYVLPA